MSQYEPFPADHFKTLLREIQQFKVRGGGGGKKNKIFKNHSNYLKFALSLKENKRTVKN